MIPTRFAAIDIGTNAILLVVAELKKDGSFQVLVDDAEITRLGEGVDRTSRIGSAGERRSLEVLRRYVETCRGLGVAAIAAVGTSALRDAENSLDFQHRLRSELGLELRVLSGEEEAGYCYLAARKGLGLSGCELLVIDVGGGSTELIHGKEWEVYRAFSLDIGSVRLTERFVHSDPVRDDEFRSMTQAIDRELERLPRNWSTEASTLTLVGVAGTFTTLAAIAQKLEQYSHSEVHGSRLTLSEVRRQVRLFQKKTICERKAIPGLEPKRADVILAGACLIERMMDFFHAEQVIVSDQGIRYGLLHERSESGRA